MYTQRENAKRIYDKTRDLFKHSRYNDVLFYCNEALKIDPSYREPFLLMGKIYLKGHEVDISTDMFKHFLRLAEKDNDYRDKARAYNALASITDFNKEFDKSVVYYKMALDISREQGDLDAIATYTNNLGLCCQRMHDYKSALNYFITALEIAKRHNDIKNMRFYYFNLAQLYGKKKKFFRAFRYMRKFQKLDRQCEEVEFRKAFSRSSK